MEFLFEGKQKKKAKKVQTPRAFLKANASLNKAAHIPPPPPNPMVG